MSVFSWIIIHQRPSFWNWSRPWAEYKAGGGLIHGDFWLGLERMHLLTSSEPCTDLFCRCKWWSTSDQFKALPTESRDTAAVDKPLVVRKVVKPPVGKVHKPLVLSRVLVVQDRRRAQQISTGSVRILLLLLLLLLPLGVVVEVVVVVVVVVPAVVVSTGSVRIQWRRRRRAPVRRRLGWWRWIWQLQPQRDEIHHARPGQW